MDDGAVKAPSPAVDYSEDCKLTTQYLHIITVVKASNHLKTFQFKRAYPFGFWTFSFFMNRTLMSQSSHAVGWSDLALFAIFEKQYISVHF